jgi:hypothetical protein
MNSLKAGEKIAELLREMPYYSARAALKVAEALVEETISADGWQSYSNVSSSPEACSQYPSGHSLSEQVR